MCCLGTSSNSHACTSRTRTFQWRERAGKELSRANLFMRAMRKRTSNNANQVVPETSGRTSVPDRLVRPAPVRGALHLPSHPSAYVQAVQNVLVVLSCEYDVDVAHGTRPSVDLTLKLGRTNTRMDRLTNEMLFLTRSLWFVYVCASSFVLELTDSMALSLCLRMTL